MSLWKGLFGPLSSQACVYFYALSIICFFVATLALLSGVVYIAKRGRFEMKNMYSGLLITANMYLAYFVNRLLYTMCTKSLN